MSNHGTALSDDTIIRVDRSTPVVYPHYWWLKNVAHPEFQAKGPPEYDLGFADGLEIQKKGILVFRKFFNGNGLYLWNSVAEDLRDGLQVSFLAELGDEVVMGWRWLGHIWDRDDPAARFPT